MGWWRGRERKREREREREREGESRCYSRNYDNNNNKYKNNYDITNKQLTFMMKYNRVGKYIILCAGYTERIIISNGST